MKTSKNISPETIKAYLAGTLSHAQTHEFEKAMLNDAVVRDMVEGYEISRNNKVDFQTINASLSERLKNRVEEGQQEVYPLWKRVPMYARAASVLLFLGVGTYFLTKNISAETTEKMALVQPIESKNISQSAPPIMAESEAITQENRVVSKQKIKAEMNKIQTEKKDFVVKESVAQGANYAEVMIDEEIATADKTTVEVEPKITQKSEPVIAYEAPLQPAPQAPKVAVPSGVMKTEERVYSRSKSAVNQINTNVISGIILNEDSNKPVPNVSIISEDKTLGKTDEKGRFSLENAQLGNKISLVAPNFENTEIMVNKTTPDLFYIRPKSELIFIDLKRNKTWKYNPAEHPAQPSVSPDEYLAYVQNNLKKPAQAIDNQIVGTVEVEFEVNKKGELSDFKITKSLGYGCDEEAIKLIREGPKWLPKIYGGDTGRQRVRQVVNF